MRRYASGKPEAHLLGSLPDNAATDFLSAEIKKLDAMSDVHASSSYRKFLANTLLHRTFALATRRASEQTNAKDREITLTVNGVTYQRATAVRKHLGDFLRQDLGLTGTHLGCEHGVCGACTVIVDGTPARSCLMLAVQADGASVVTVEGLASPNGALHPIQQAFRDKHALQCGFCTPGMLTTLVAFLAEQTKCRRGGNSRCNFRKYLPLHRLRVDR